MLAPNDQGGRGAELRLPQDGHIRIFGLLVVLATADMSLAAERPPSLGNGSAVIIAQAMPGQTNRMGPGMGGQMPQQMPGAMMGDSAGAWQAFRSAR